MESRRPPCSLAAGEVAHEILQYDDCLAMDSLDGSDTCESQWDQENLLDHWTTADREAIKEKYDKDQQVKEFLLSVQSNDWARYQKMCVQRQKELDNTTQRMRLFERWDLQRGVEEKRERAEAARLATERAAKEAARLAAEAREAKAVAAEASRVADERLTQETLKYMRVAGTIAGVNAPEAEEPGVARETDAALTLRVRPGADAAHPDPAKKDDAKRAPAKEDLRENMDYMVTKDAAGDRKKKNVPFFTVELRRFRNVTTMKGEKLGPTGAKQLVKELVAGACPRLASLDLAVSYTHLTLPTILLV